MVTYALKWFTSSRYLPWYILIEVTAPLAARASGIMLAEAVILASTLGSMSITLTPSQDTYITQGIIIPQVIRIQIWNIVVFH